MSSRNMPTQSGGHGTRIVDPRKADLQERPMKTRWTLVVAIALAVAGTARAQTDAFGRLQPASAAEAKAKAIAWLKGVGKADPATLQRVAAIWKSTDRTIVDLVADTLALGDERAAKLLAEVRDPAAPAPTSVPDFLMDAKAKDFFRVNLALAYGRALTQRQVHEEALAVLRTLTPESVVDPAALLFHRALSEHAMLMKDDATRTITRLIDAAATAPERYQTVAALMLLDMQTWKEKDLGAVARKMQNIERRLGLARGGPETQKLQ